MLGNMNTWQVWTIAIPLIVLAATFFIMMLAIVFAIKQATGVLKGIEDKLHAIDPLCRIVHRLGDLADEKVEHFCERDEPRYQGVFDLVALGVELFRNFRGKR